MKNTKRKRSQDSKQDTSNSEDLSNTDATILAYLDEQYKQKVAQMAKKQKTTHEKNNNDSQGATTGSASIIHSHGIGTRNYANHGAFVKIFPSEIWHCIASYCIKSKREAHLFASVCKGTC